MTQGFKQFYVDAPLAVGNRVALPENLQHRLRTVLRNREGVELNLMNGKDGVFTAMLEDGKARWATVTDQTKPFSALPPRTLFLGQPKRDAWETVLRQATELGVTTLVPLHTDYTVASTINTARAHALMVEAAEQCERMCLPTLTPPQPLQKALAAWHTANPNEKILWADERLSTPTPIPTATAVLVGPEGGFSPDEQAWLETQLYVVPISLGSTVLRTDTAVVATLAKL
ncbi:MAG: RsmE family RNA methyltransferase [Alphaproteobacteria bacterium]